MKSAAPSIAFVLPQQPSRRAWSHLPSPLPVAVVLALALGFHPLVAKAGGMQGDIVETDTLGMTFDTYRFDTQRNTTVVDSAPFSEFIGLHYYLANNVRIGFNFQFTQLLTTPAEGESRFSNFSVLPQVGWDFWGPLFVAGVLTISPRAYSTNDLELGVQAVLGAAVKLAPGLKGSLALEVPFNFLERQSIGLTVLAGISAKI